MLVLLLVFEALATSPTADGFTYDSSDRSDLYQHFLIARLTKQSSILEEIFLLQKLYRPEQGDRRRGWRDRRCRRRG